MGVSRSGYYKWKKRDKSARDLRREEVIALVSQVHEAHPSHGYRWVAAFIRINHQQNISDNYVYKAFRFLGIKAKTKHQVHYRPRKDPRSVPKSYLHNLGYRRSSSPGNCFGYDHIEVLDFLF